jgi:putative SOS response-associated peptidase YedK
VCGRYALYTDPETLMTLFELSDVPKDLVPRYNIAPSQEVSAVRRGADGGREWVRLKWGLVPSWAKAATGGYKMINARSETAAQRPAFRGPLARRRCLLPADGFYEWRRPAGGGRATPYFIHRRDGRPMALAGIWDRWQGDGGTVESCAILTTAANAVVAAVHDRMPVLVARSNHARWLDPAATEVPAALLAPAPPDALALHAVGPGVNSPRNDVPELVRPA